MNPPRKKRAKSQIPLKKRSISAKEINPEKELELQSKIISKKKVLFTDIDAEITSIYDKLKKYKMKNIYIVVPKRAILFQSIVNLRILKRKAEDIKKNVFIITNDTNGMQLASRAGFSVFDKLEGNEHPSLVSGKLADDQLKISPLTASINTFEDDTPTRLKSKKISIAEIIRRTKKSPRPTKRPLTLKAKEKEKRKREKNRYVLVSPNRQALTILITVSVLILFLIVYIAIPGATIKITPKSNTLTVSANVTLANESSNRNYLDTHPPTVIASFPVDTTIVKTITYHPTGNKFEGKNASGTITIMNTSGKEWPLIEQTRFQTDEGLVFRIQKGITVPAASISSPGTLDAFVVADETDANGQIIGKRGNISANLRFFLPGLSNDNRKKIYAENKSAFTGGQTITHKMISADDLDAARGKMEAELTNSVEEELKMRLLKINQEKNVELTLLTSNRAFYTDAPIIKIPENLEGKITDSFEVTGQMYVKGISYNYNELLNILRAKLKISRNPEKILTKIDTESVSIRLIPIEDGDDQSRQKITATIKGIEQYEISPEKEGGRRIIKNIKEHIMGKSVKEAEIYVQQLPSVNSVSIDSWPAWSPNIPSVPDNIKIQVVESL